MISSENTSPRAPSTLLGLKTSLAIAQDVLRPNKVSGALGKVFSLVIIQPPFTFPVK